ncbi:hypothetical protein HQ45_07230 [Porphyromonas crevioricanis]|uniref:Rod shape-determining protein MreD n=1 Tax=Porphyromonas crevioricanis TaxID=393921 RepID=A0AB34PFB5_9PORP|nr:hypothetical protein [Porphyromonas crevioricanis]KGN89324.1 hypothetical protein HQ45_07230 [Porphyromonas crevioricanis]KGN93700.1 hypothetical protein HQ38_08675 [Porphyromonas crevioricanis]SKA02318.1 rod shape-determining protein MreD [Porphyromonas crevioricanis]
MHAKQHLSCILSAVLLALCQVWLFSPVSLFGFATPLVYVYILLMIPHRASPLTTLLYGFFCGMLVDILGNSPGLHTAALTATAFLRNYIAVLFVSDDIELKHLRPGLRLMGGRFYLFLFLLSGLHTLLVFLLDAWSLFDPLHFVTRTVSSWVATYIFLLLLHLLFGGQKANHRH